MSGNLKLNTPSNGSVTLSTPDTASAVTVTIPAATDTVTLNTQAQTLTNKTLTAAGANSVEATSGPTSTQLAGNRNKIINGAMMIDQRNAGASVTPTSDATYVLDRWQTRLGVASKYSVQQNAGSITPPSGFTNYLGITSLSSYSSGATEYFGLCQKIEGYNIADLSFGGSSAKTITLSFWVRSSLTGTFSGLIYNNNADQNYNFTYTVSSANTWTNVSCVITGDTAGTWGTTSGAGLIIWFDLGSGSNYTGSAQTWTGNFLPRVTGSQSVVGTNGATFYITGVQLEKGSVATPFENRQYGTELALCQRYTYILRGDSGQAGYARNPIFGNATTSAIWYPIYPVTMRTVPSLVTSNFTSTNVEIYNYANSGGATLTSVSLAEGSTNSGQITFNATGGGLTSGSVASWRWVASPSAYIGFNAEL